MSDTPKNGTACFTFRSLRRRAGLSLITFQSGIRAIETTIHLQNDVKSVQYQIRNEFIEESFFLKQPAEPAGAYHRHQLFRKTFGLHALCDLTDRAGGAEKEP